MVLSVPKAAAGQSVPLAAIADAAAKMMLLTHLVATSASGPGALWNGRWLGSPGCRFDPFPKLVRYDPDGL